MCQLSFEHENLYGVLGVPTSASTSEVRTAYRRAALCSHPDKGGSAESFHRVAVAFEVLSCPVTRNLYDHRLACQKKVNLESSQCATENLVACHPRPTANAGSKRCNPESASNFEQAQVTSQPRAQKISRIDDALRSLRTVLQSMETDQRQTCIPTLPFRVRSALLTFMEGQRLKPRGSIKASILETPAPVNTTSIRKGGLRTIRGMHRAKYQACIRIKALRVYTKETFDIEAAVEHQIILAGLRQKIATETTENPSAWLNPFKLIRSCVDALAQQEATEESLGLRVYLEFRTSPWCHPRCCIYSPASSGLLEALELNAQLLRARSTSWEALQREWINILTISRRPQSKALTLAEATEVTGKARQAALQKQMHRAVSAVERAVVKEALLVARAQQRTALRQKKFTVKRRRNCEWSDSHLV